MGKHPALIAASIGALSTRVILPTRPYFSLSRYSAVKTPVGMGRARVPSRSRAAVSLRFSCRKTRYVGQLKVSAYSIESKPEAYSGDLEGLGVGDSDTILVVWHNSFGL